MAAAAPCAGGGGNADAGKDGGGVPRHVSTRAELVRRWEDVFDNVGDYDKAMDLFMALLLRDARAEHAQQARNEEEEERRARVFEPWHPTPPGSAPPPQQQVERTVVLGLRAPPHLLPPRKDERARTPPPSAPAVDLGRPVKPANKNTRGGV